MGDATAIVQKKDVEELLPRDAEVILGILTECARGNVTLEKLFAGSLEMTIDQYWRRKKRFPIEVQALHEAAHEVVRRERLDTLVGFAGRQMERTIELRESAAEALVGSIEELARIARGDDKIVEDAKGREKCIIAYPRDVTRAVEMLLKIAQGGVVLLEEHEMLLLPQKSKEIEEKEDLPLLPQSVGIHFTSVAIPPGATVEIQSPEVVEGEFVGTIDRSGSDIVPEREFL